MMNATTAERLAGFRFYTVEEEAEERRLGVSTKLKLYDPWTIRKILYASDVNGSSRLLLGKDYVNKYVIPYMEPCGSTVEGCLTESKGVKVTLCDLDTNSKHELKLKRWSTKSFVLTSNWKKEFVTRRGLEIGDEVGLFWDPCNSYFCFSRITKGGEFVEERLLDPPNRR